MKIMIIHIVQKLREQKKIKIKTITLNNFLNLKKCFFLKIDVERMELSVLKLAKDFINKFKPIIWIENHREYKLFEQTSSKN